MHEDAAILSLPDPLVASLFHRFALAEVDMQPIAPRAKLCANQLPVGLLAFTLGHVKNGRANRPHSQQTPKALRFRFECVASKYRRRSWPGTLVASLMGKIVVEQLGPAHPFS
jgi:hypothetical protein